MSADLQNALAGFLVAALPMALALLRAWLSERRASDEKTKAEAVKAESAALAELKQAALEAVMKGIQKMKNSMPPEQKKETNNTIQALTLEAGVEDLVSKTLDRIKKEIK